MHSTLRGSGTDPVKMEPVQGLLTVALAASPNNSDDDDETETDSNTVDGEAGIREDRETEATSSATYDTRMTPQASGLDDEDEDDAIEGLELQDACCYEQAQPLLDGLLLL